MSVQRRRIERAVRSRGYEIASLEWEPIGMAMEMCGPDGGWTLVVDRSYLANTFPGDDLFGYSVEELLAEIDFWLAPNESCECPALEYSPMIAGGIKGDPQVPAHLPDCKWHIRYHLRWWRNAA